MWRHYMYGIIYLKTVKKKKKGKKWRNLFLTTKFLGTSDFHRVYGKSLLEWKVKYKKISLGSVKELYTHFLTTTLLFFFFFLL